MAQFRSPYTHFKRLSFPNSFKITKPTVDTLVSSLPLRVLPVPRKFPTLGEGATARLKKLRKTVTALVINERLELNFHRGDEARGYCERLISECIRYGPLHRPTMDLCKFWIEDEAAIPKVFKVLVPRFQNWPLGMPYTRMLRAPSTIKDHLDNDQLQYFNLKAVLELRGNPYPPLPGPMAKAHPAAIHNVLLEEARKAYFRGQSKIEKEVEREVNA